MPSKKIPLREIERSIAVNCTIDRKAGKALQIPKAIDIKNQGLGRAIFILLAVKCGWREDEICDYLGIRSEEFKHKVAILDDLCTNGKKVFNSLDTTGPFIASRDTYLFFYRKLLLAQNYLRFRWGYQP